MKTSLGYIGADSYSKQRHEAAEKRGGGSGFNRLGVACPGKTANPDGAAVEPAFKSSAMIFARITIDWFMVKSTVLAMVSKIHYCLKEENMTIEKTLSIIKPDAVAKNVIGQIYARFEAAGLKIVAAKMVHLSRGEAEAFYAVHKARPFFKDLVDFMISGPIMIQALEGENAILKNRDLMGATDPKKADPGTIRADFADSIDANAVHGSDAAETAAIEIAFFFPGMNIYSR